MADTAEQLRPRGFTTALVLIFALFSAAGFYFMRIENAINGVPIDFDRICMSGKWNDGTPIKQSYTGLRAIDVIFTWLVPAFITGPAGWDEGIRLQQIHFLVNFFAVVSIWNIEAARKRNQGRLISYTALWAVFYQTIAGAAIIPLYYLSYATVSAKKDYLASGREVPVGYARALLPALVVGYLVPTIALYIPLGDLDTKQNLTALWQIAPALPNLLLLILVPLFSFASSSARRTGPSSPSDVRHLKGVYFAIGVVSTITQVYTWYICLTSNNPQLSFSYVFLPNKALWKESTSLGLHYIFQWDFWIIYASSLVWCWLVVMDYLKQLRGPISWYYTILSAFNILLVSVVAGPGTALALVWNSREKYMLQIDRGAQNPKVA